LGLALFATSVKAQQIHMPDERVETILFGYRLGSDCYMRNNYFSKNEIDLLERFIREKMEPVLGSEKLEEWIRKIEDIYQQRGFGTLIARSDSLSKDRFQRECFAQRQTLNTLLLQIR
jgi:hypothetical protein